MQIRVVCLLAVAALGMLPTASQGQESLSLTLSEALTFARDRNPDLLAARQELEVARGRLVKARYPSQFNPELGSEVANRSRGESGERGSDIDFSVTLSQEIEIAGQRGKRIDEAERNLAVVTQRIQDRERLVLAQVKESFYRALALRRRFDLFRQVEDLNRRLRAVATVRFQAGEISKLEVNLAEIQLGQARKDTLTAERDYRNTLRELERRLGQEPRGTAELTGQLAVQPQTFDEQMLLGTALESRPDLQAARTELGRLDAEMALTRRLVVPNPTLSFVYREEEKRDHIAGAEIRFPLPVFDRKQAELVQLAGRKDQAGYERQSVELQVRQEVGEALRAYNTAKAEVEVYEQTVLERATENFQLIETAYREGQINLLQLVVVQNNLITAQLSYIDALNAYWQARTALERATGTEL
ncbi:MAG: TolC family protein [Deltaproteobacteria bacterium]|nr:TolC family protein [Deltaproteobacteria bacterium]